MAESASCSLGAHRESARAETACCVLASSLHSATEYLRFLCNAPSFELAQAAKRPGKHFFPAHLVRVALPTLSRRDATHKSSICHNLSVHSRMMGRWKIKDAFRFPLTLDMHPYTVDGLNEAEANCSGSPTVRR